MNTDGELNDDPFPFQAGVFEIQNQSNPQTCDPEIVYHLTTFMVSDAIDDFCIHDHSAKANQVGHEFADLNSTEENGEPPLLFESNLVLFESDRQRNLVDLLVQPVPHFVQHSESMSQNSLSLLSQEEFGVTAML
jgi:hypothetical protein